VVVVEVTVKQTQSGYRMQVNHNDSLVTTTPQPFYGPFSGTTRV